MNILDYFPKGREPRKEQIEVFPKIQQAIDKGIKFIVLGAPTGFGKSMVPATLANMSKEPDPDFIRRVESYSIFRQGSDGGFDETPWELFGCTTLTITKNLQDQYGNDFDDIEILKGQANYQCEFDPDYDVENAPCKGDKRLLGDCWACNRCTYYNQRNEALTSKFSALNYRVFFSLPDHVKSRQFLVLDEASELEKELVSNFTFQIKKESLVKLDIQIKELRSEDEYVAREWLINLQEQVAKKNGEAYEKLKDKKNSVSFSKNKVIYKATLHLLNKITSVMDNWTLNGENSRCTEYVVEVKEDEYIFTPLKVDNLSRNVFDYADHIILMSASFVNWKKTCKDLGINIKNAVYIESPPCFDPKKSPIYVSEKYPLTQKFREVNLPHVAELVKQICDKHANEKGIIHTHSFEITKAVREKLKGDRFIFREDGATNADIMEVHTSTHLPTVLVSPSMTHGVDLKGDLGKFQIITKIPYLPLGSKRIKILSKRDFTWYNNQMLSTLIQACGRCTRTAEDEAVTYIVDGSIANVITKSWDILPKYFRDRFV